MKSLKEKLQLEILIQNEIASLEAIKQNHPRPAFHYLDDEEVADFIECFNMHNDYIRLESNRGSSVRILVGIKYIDTIDIYNYEDEYYSQGFLGMRLSDGSRLPAQIEKSSIDAYRKINIIVNEFLNKRRW